MKKECITLGLTGLLLMPASLDYSMQNAQVSSAETPRKHETLNMKVESELYKFADELSRKMPEGFIKEEFNNQFYYHDKTLKIEGGLPMEGSGRYVITDENGVVSLGDWTASREKTDIANVKSALACHYPGGNLVIILIKNPFVIQYVKSALSWERQVYDISELKAMTVKDAEPKEKTKVENKEPLKYLELLERIRKTYPAPKKQRSSSQALTA